MSSVDLNMVGASRQMEKCEECRKENVKQKVGQAFPAKMSTLNHQVISNSHSDFWAPVHTSRSCLASSKV
jgi:hypothetical protein